MEQIEKDIRAEDLRKGSLFRRVLENFPDAGPILAFMSIEAGGKINAPDYGILIAGAVTRARTISQKPHPESIL